MYNVNTNLAVFFCLSLAIYNIQTVRYTDKNSLSFLVMLISAYFSLLEETVVSLESLATLEAEFNKFSEICKGFSLLPVF